jgi:predicted nucleic acid-binding protein
MELDKGAALGYLTTRAWDWLDAVRLFPSEERNLSRIRSILDDGEASCIAVAIERNASLFSDDLDARRYARRHGIRVSGTLGVLSLLVRGRYLAFEDADNLLRAMIAHGYRSPVSSLADLADELS